MEDKINLNYVLESQGARFERSNKRLFIIIIVLIITLISTNGLWIAYESQWGVTETTTTITQDLDASDGGNAIINDGVHINGESETDSKDDD